MKLRFSIRDLLWLLALLATIAAWWFGGTRSRSWRSEKNEAGTFITNQQTGETIVIPVAGPIGILRIPK